MLYIRVQCILRERDYLVYTTICEGGYASALCTGGGAKTSFFHFQYTRTQLRIIYQPFVSSVCREKTTAVVVGGGIPHGGRLQSYSGVLYHDTQLHTLMQYHQKGHGHAHITLPTIALPSFVI